MAEVIVVDNSADARVPPDLAGDPRLRTLTMRTNLGYGRAANVGLDAAGAPAVLVCNQDVALLPGAVARLLAAARTTGAWLIGPGLVDDDGRPAPPKPASPELHEWEPPPRDPAWPASWHTVPWCSGAALLFAPGHTDLRFDRRFFMYVEDEELGVRVWEQGGTVVWAGDVTVTHTGGTATSRRWGRPTVALRILAGRVRLARRHGTVAAVRFAIGAVGDRVRRTWA
jgi:N-acetylglucosaminyl-diphospho-decaprenol L-rhamnosyltransferase